MPTDVLVQYRTDLTTHNGQKGYWSTRPCTTSTPKMGLTSYKGKKGSWKTISCSKSSSVSKIPAYTYSIPTTTSSSSKTKTKCSKTTSSSSKTKTKCSKTKSSTSAPAYSTLIPTTKTKTIVYTKPCSACTSGTTVKTATLTATSCTTVPQSYVTKTVSETTTVWAKHSSATPYVKTATTCKTFTVPATKSWIWPSHSVVVPTPYTTSTVWAYSVGTTAKCPTTKKACWKRNIVETTESIPVSTIGPPQSYPTINWSEGPSTVHSTLTSHVTSTKTKILHSTTRTPYVSAYSTSCPSSTTQSATVNITSTPTPYVSAYSTWCPTTATYSSGNVTWTSQYMTSTIVTPVGSTTPPTYPTGVIPPPSGNCKHTALFTDATPTDIT